MMILKEALQNLTFPMFVKDHNGGDSVGITEESKCNNSEELTKNFN